MIPGIGVGVGFSGYRSLEAQIAAIPGRYVWLRSDSGITDVSGKASVWADRSGAAVSVTQGTDSKRPLIYDGGGANNRPYLRFGDSAASYMGFASGVLQTLAGVNNAVECYMVFSRDSDPAVIGNGGLHSMRGVALGSHIPYINGEVYDAFFTNTRHTAGTISGLTANCCCYGVASSTTGWRNSLNGTELYSTGSNSYTVLATTGIGASADDDTTYLQGRFYEVLLFNRWLTAGQRAKIQQYVAARYGI